ncbi:MAG: hypothetical protein ABR562_02270, partial [Thermoplasmatota archaeon]
MEGPIVQVAPKRDWAAYTLAQEQEAVLFDQLLHDLCVQLPTPPYERGRPPTPPSVLAYCAVKKEYTGFSSRRQQGVLAKDDCLQRVPNHNAVSFFRLANGTADLLRGLVRRSALPLSNIEEMFAVDSTGFACGTYGTYR